MAQSPVHDVTMRCNGGPLWGDDQVAGPTGTRTPERVPRGPALVWRGYLAGRMYLERGAPVVVVTSWGPGGGPRNVAIRRPDGTVVVRPFRGLRRPS
jgi:acetyl esterase